MNAFVYGTLLSGERNNYLLETSTKLGKDTVPGFMMVNLGAFPALISTDSETVPPVLGEVWEIDADTLQRLDWLEGYPRLYDRKEVDTSFGKAWVYFMHEERVQDGLQVITSGSWKQFLGKE